MADQHNDNIPAIANQISNDIPDIKENLEYHKDVFEAFVNSWSSTVATNIKPVIMGDADNDTLIQLEESADEDTIRFDCGGTEVANFADTLFTFNSVPKYWEKASPSAASSSQFTSLDTGGQYKIRYRLTLSTSSTLKISFNSVSTTGYYVIYEITYTAANLNTGSGTNTILLNYTGRTYHVGEFTFGTINDTEEVLLDSRGSHFTDTSNVEVCMGNGYIDLGESISSITIAPSSGTMTGTIVLERLS